VIYAVRPPSAPRYNSASATCSRTTRSDPERSPIVRATRGDRSSETLRVRNGTPPGPTRSRGRHAALRVRQATLAYDRAAMLVAGSGKLTRSRTRMGCAHPAAFRSSTRGGAARKLADFRKSHQFRCRVRGYLANHVVTVHCAKEGSRLRRGHRRLFVRHGSSSPDLRSDG
jgi:hypothetical protein